MDFGSACLYFGLFEDSYIDTDFTWETDTVTDASSFTEGRTFVRYHGIWIVFFMLPQNIIHDVILCITLYSSKHSTI